MFGSVVHRFPGNTSAEVYAFTQTSNTVKDGDILVVPDEGVVGVLVAAWPVAVSAEAGAFHQPAAGFDWSAVEWNPDAEPRDYRASVAVARREDIVGRISEYAAAREPSPLVDLIKAYAA